MLLQVPAVFAGKETDHPVEIAMTGVQSPALSTNIPSLVLNFRALRHAAVLTIQIEATGAFGLRTEAEGTTNLLTITVTNVTAYVSKNRLELRPLVVRPLETGEILVKVRALDAAGLTLNAMELAINGFFTEGMVFYGTDSLMSLRNNAISDRERRGVISADEARRCREALTTFRQP